MSDWLYEGRPFTQPDVGSWFGFVYLITNLETGRRYVGKKFFTKAKTRFVKKRKRRTRAESDWATYYGSNKELRADVEELGVDKFERTILALCASRGECTYLEAKYQFEMGVLLDPGFYNEWISCKIHKSHVSRLSSSGR